MGYDLLGWHLLVRTTIEVVAEIQMGLQVVNLKCSTTEP